MTDVNDQTAQDDIFLTEDDDDIVVEGGFDPIDFSPSQRRVQDLNSDFANGDLDPRPAFQRGYVWDRTKASRLVESILLNVPLPLVYTAEESDGKELVIDGQQRLLSLFGFIKGEFPKDNKRFRLSNLKILSTLNGLAFDDLSEDLQRKFRRYNLSIIKINHTSHSDVKFEIFERLNTGSVKLNAQELRNCVYRGAFNEFLKDMTHNEYFQKCLGTTAIMQRSQDAELVLRFCAFKDRTYLNYNGGMKSFLNDYMDENRNISEAKQQKIGDAFKQAAELSYTVFGQKAFRRYAYGTQTNPEGGWERQVNRALFDVIMWGFTLHDRRQIVAASDVIRDRFIQFSNEDREFRESITAATGDKGRTRYRFERWKEQLEDVITTPSDERRLFSRAEKRELYEASPICGICQNEIYAIDDAAVDHVRPYSAGGETDLSNAQIAHRYCNSVKSDRLTA